jgi:glycosyltransferase involved in cell wall biosynthesis
MISVLLPVYNAAAALPAALETTLAQTGASFEVVAVDDGSTDPSPQILAHYARRDSRLRILSRPHRGLVAALNAGLDACRGELVARMDADDRMLPGRLTAQAALLAQRADLAGCACPARVEPAATMTPGARRYLDWNNSLITPRDIRRQVFIESPLIHPTVMLRRSVLEAAGGWREFDGPEDYDLWLRLLFDHGAELAKVPRTLHVWRDHGDRLTRTDPRYRAAAFLELKARYLAEYVVRPRGGYVLWGCGPVGKALLKALRRQGIERPAAIVEVHPGRLGEIIHGAPVIPPAAVDDYQTYIHLGAVGQAGSRERLRREFAAHGLREGRDAFFTA